MLSVLFTSAARVAVLRIFLVDPIRSYYQRQLESATGLPIRAVQRELDRLTKSGLLYRRLEGRRAYYSIDRAVAGYDALRELFLIDADPVNRLRATLAVDPLVELAFLSKGNRILVITSNESWMIDDDSLSDTFAIKSVSRESFEQQLASGEEELDAFLKSGEDILGRRDDIIWRRIEDAGYQVDKGKGIP